MCLNGKFLQQKSTKIIIENYETSLASITCALWAKRGERGILPEARDGREEKMFFLLPSSGDSRLSRGLRKMPC